MNFKCFGRDKKVTLGLLDFHPMIRPKISDCPERYRNQAMQSYGRKYTAVHLSIAILSL